MKQHFKVESTWAIVNMLIYGNCVSCLPSYVAKDALKEKKLKVVKISDFASSCRRHRRRASGQMVVTTNEGVDEVVSARAIGCESGTADA